MTLNDFIKKYDGKGVDYDKNGKFWCVDIFRAYCKEVLEFPQSPVVTGAADIWDTYLKDYFDRINNTPEGVPDKGSVMLWDKNVGGGYGHVALFVEGDTNSFKSFEQNWPTGSLCHTQGHYYKNILGWLKPRTGVVADYYQGIDLNNKESIKVCIDIWKAVVDGEYIKKEANYEDAISDLEDKVKGLNEALATKSLEVNTIKANLEAQERDNTDLAKQLGEARSQRDSFSRQVKEADAEFKRLAETIGKLETDLTTAEETQNALKTQLAASVRVKIRAMSLFGLLKVKYFDKGGEKNGS